MHVTLAAALLLSSAPAQQLAPHPAQLQGDKQSPAAGQAAVEVEVDLAARARAASARASRWLAAQQEPNGRWNPSSTPVLPGGGTGDPGDERALTDDEFWDKVLGGGALPTDGSPDPAPQAEAPSSTYAVGVSGLAILALCADGQCAKGAPHREAVLKGAGWLAAQQDTESGCIGSRLGFAYLYDHAIATVALLAVHREAPTADIGFGSNARARVALQARIQRALNFNAMARNPYRVWRYDVPPNGDNDTSVTTWMALAHVAGQRQGFEVDSEATVAVLEWMDEMTEEGTGRVGYTERGSASSRVPGLNEQFDVTSTETLTAAGLMCRLELGQSARSAASVRHVSCIMRALPEGGAGPSDALWVYFGTRALSGVGSRPWELWSERVLEGVLAQQATEGALAGSWEPKTAWAYASGRIGTTALMGLAASRAASH